MTIFVQLNRVKNPITTQAATADQYLWSPPATRWVGSFIILSPMKQGLEYQFCD